MNKEELAEKLNGNQYRDELSDELNEIAKESGLLVIYGGSDDLLYLGGVGDDELGCYGGGELIICKDGDAEMLDYIDDLEGEDDERLAKLKDSHQNGNVVMAEWCEIEDYSWAYTSEIPYATFDIMEDGDKYCRGMVIDTKDLK